MQEVKDFFHAGFGWICRACDRELRNVEQNLGGRSRIFTEGEAESRIPDMSTRALAKWVDPARRFLVCPRCGITEDTEIH